MSVTLRLVLSVFLTGLASSLGAQTLQDLATKVGAKVLWEPFREVALLSNSSHRLTVDLGLGRALGDGDKIFELMNPDTLTGRLSGEDFSRLLSWWRSDLSAPTPVQEPTPRPASPGRRIQVLVLDAGHGGSDPGSIGRHSIDGKDVVLQEKDLTLAVVLELQKLLTKEFPDRDIVLTRSGDTYPTLEKRVQVAHAQKLGENESIFFLSVHFNASLNRKANGLELWYVPQDFERDVLVNSEVPQSVLPMLNTLVDEEYKKQSRELAVQLAQGLAQELGDSSVRRGLKENPWFVVRMARMPAVLAELGFITNPDEAKLFQDPEYLKKLAHGLYTGLVSFIHTYEDQP